MNRILLAYDGTAEAEAALAVAAELATKLGAEVGVVSACRCTPAGSAAIAARPTVSSKAPPVTLMASG
jgi:nucleotide-binding universal stress UspA family protein